MQDLPKDPVNSNRLVSRVHTSTPLVGLNPDPSTLGAPFPSKKHVSMCPLGDHDSIVVVLEKSKNKFELKTKCQIVGYDIIDPPHHKNKR